MSFSKTLGNPMKNKSWYPADSVRDTLIGTTSIFSFLLLWEMLPAMGWVDPFFSSSPSRILATGQDMFMHGFWYDIPAPRVALIPLMILWLGIGLQSKIAAVMLGAFFPLVISVTKSIHTLDNNLLRCARSFGASDFQILWTLVLPNSVPFVISGLHIAIGRGLVGVVIGELLASQAGVGHVMAVASATFQTDKLFVGLVCLSGFGLFLTKVLEYFEKIFNRWRIS
jgi:NitT/TauT family transport system permease protein